MLMYPKQKTKKRRKKHPPSIVRQEPGTCYLCVRLHGNYVQHRALHKHHVYDGPNKPISEEHGFWVYVCWRHHTYGKEAAHEQIDSLRIMQEDVQREYEKTHTRQQFMALIGRNYLEEDKDDRGENTNTAGRSVQIPG